NYGMEKYVQPVLSVEPVNEEKLSSGLQELYTRMISVAIKNAKEKRITAEETQPVAQETKTETTTQAGAPDAQPSGLKAQSSETVVAQPASASPQSSGKNTSADDALAARVIADATSRTQDASDGGNEGEAKGRARPLGLNDPGMPPSYEEELPPRPSVKHYVCDWGDLLMPSDRAYVEYLGSKLDQLTTAELVLVTVPTRGNMPIKEFSVKIANGWGIGKKDKNNGCMLLGIRDRLMRMQSGKIRIEVGRYLEGRLNDAKCGRILDDLALPPFYRDNSTKDEQSAGLVSAYEYLAKEIAAEYGKSLGIDINVYKLPESPQGDFTIADMGKLMTEEDRTVIERLGRKLQEKTGKRLFLVTLPEVNGNYGMNNVCLEMMDCWKVLREGKKDHALVLVNTGVLFDEKVNRMYYGFCWGSNLNKAIDNNNLNRLYKELLAPLKKPDKKDKEPKTIDRQACSHAFRDFYICLVQEIAGNGKCKDGAKLLELPEGTICLDDLKTDDIYIYIGIYVFFAIILLFTYPPVGLLMLVWPILVVMLLFPKGRKWLRDAWNTPVSSSRRSYHSSSYDRGYSRSYSSSSSSSSSSSYGGGSFGGGGADR
ncbi:MAG: TPM domain-containing protein, partial [Victivallales bacterium]|nr:TPM domain-containing protein [Victivallales bacterium]